MICAVQDMCSTVDRMILMSRRDQLLLYNLLCVAPYSFFVNFYILRVRDIFESRDSRLSNLGLASLKPDTFTYAFMHLFVLFA